jgi:hypothetical protein
MLVNIKDYDYYIYAINNSKVEYNFNKQMVNIFNVQQSVGFLGEHPQSSLLNDESLNYFSKEVYCASGGKYVNLDYYSHFFKNILLKMDIRGNEFDWLNYINQDKLLSYKQMVITFYKKMNDEIANKLNETHYIMYIQQNSKLAKTITYIRKDLVSNSIQDDGSANTSSFNNDDANQDWGWAWEITTSDENVIKYDIEDNSNDEDLHNEESYNNEDSHNEEPCIEEPRIEETNIDETNNTRISEDKDEFEGDILNIDNLRTINKDRLPNKKTIINIIGQSNKNPLNNRLTLNKKKSNVLTKITITTKTSQQKQEPNKQEQE